MNPSLWAGVVPSRRCSSPAVRRRSNLIRATIAIASTRAESAIASPTWSIGGESIRTRSARSCSRSSNSDRALDVTSSPGSGGTGPLAMTSSRPPPPFSWIVVDISRPFSCIPSWPGVEGRIGTLTAASSSSASWTMTSVIPGLPPSSEKNRLMRGRRRSRSMRTTCRPARAKASARLATVVDFPSSATALVTMIERTSRSTIANSRFVRSILNASASLPLGSATVASRSSSRNCFGGSGMRARRGRSRRAPSSSAPWTRVSSASRTKANPTPRTTPSRSPITPARTGCGETCEAPSGVSITLALEV